MYIDIDSRLRVNLMDMNDDEMQALITMIRGAGLHERRIFHRVLQQLTVTPVDELIFESRCRKSKPTT